MALEKLISDGTPVPVVASYGMTSGSTPSEGITAQMLYYDPARDAPQKKAVPVESIAVQIIRSARS